MQVSCKSDILRSQKLFILVTADQSMALLIIADH